MSDYVLADARAAVAAGRAAVQAGTPGGHATLGSALLMAAPLERRSGRPQSLHAATEEARAVLLEGAVQHNDVAAMIALADSMEESPYWALYWRDRAVRTTSTSTSTTKGGATHADALSALGRMLLSAFRQPWCTGSGTYRLRRVLYRAFAVAAAAAASVPIDLDRLAMPGRDARRAEGGSVHDDPGWQSAACPFSGSPAHDVDRAVESLRAATMDGLALLEQAVAEGDAKAADWLGSFWRAWKDDDAEKRWKERSAALLAAAAAASDPVSAAADAAMAAAKSLGRYGRVLHLLGGTPPPIPEGLPRWESDWTAEFTEALIQAVKDRAATIVASPGGDVEVVARAAAELQAWTDGTTKVQARELCAWLARTASDAGSATAALEHGRFLDAIKDRGKPSDGDGAVLAAYRRAVELGHVRALVVYGDLLCRVSGSNDCKNTRPCLPYDGCTTAAQILQRGLGLLQRAADLNDSLACLYFGMAYDRHAHLPSDFGRAVAYYQRGAALGSPGAQFLLALYYELGLIDADADGQAHPTSAVSGAAHPTSAVSGASNPTSALSGAADPTSALSGAPDPSALSGAAVPSTASARVTALLGAALPAPAASLKTGSARAAALVQQAAAQGLEEACSLLALWQVRGNHVGIDRDVCAAARWHLSSVNDRVAGDLIEGLAGRVGADRESGLMWSPPANADKPSFVHAWQPSDRRLISDNLPWITMLVAQCAGEGKSLREELSSQVDGLRPPYSGYTYPTPALEAALASGYHALEALSVRARGDVDDLIEDPVAKPAEGDEDGATTRVDLQAALTRAAAVGSHHALFILARQHERAAVRTRRTGKDETNDEAAMLEGMADILYERGLRRGSSVSGARLLARQLGQTRLDDAASVAALVRTLESLHDLDAQLVWPVLVRLIAEGVVTQFGGQPVDRAWAARLLRFAAASETLESLDGGQRTLLYVNWKQMDPIGAGARAPPPMGAALLMAAECSRCGFLGTDIHPERAVALILGAANAGSPDALAHLGRAFESGSAHLPRDLARAVLLYGIALEDGSALGSLHLGRLHLLGRGVSQHYGRAERLLQEAATQLGAVMDHQRHGAGGIGGLLGALADVVANSPATTFPDLATAAELYQLAAEHGHGCAAKLAAMYRRAQGWVDDGSPARARLADLERAALTTAPVLSASSALGTAAGYTDTAHSAVAPAAAAPTPSPVPVSVPNPTLMPVPVAAPSDVPARATDWTTLPTELLEAILHMLPLDDWLQCRRVCVAWKEVVDTQRAADLVAGYRCQPFSVAQPVQLWEAEPKTTGWTTQSNQVNFLPPLWLESLVAAPVLCLCGAIVLEAPYRMIVSGGTIVDWEAFARTSVRTYAQRHLGQLPVAPWGVLAAHDRVASELMDLADELAVAIWLAGTAQAHDMAPRRLRDGCFIGYGVHMPIDLPRPRTDAAMRDLVAAVLFGAPGWNKRTAPGTPVTDLAARSHPVWRIGAWGAGGPSSAAPADTFATLAPSAPAAPAPTPAPRRPRRGGVARRANGGAPVVASYPPVESLESLVLKYEAVRDAFHARGTQSVANFLDTRVGPCPELREATDEQPKAVGAFLAAQVAAVRAVAAVCGRHLTGVVVGSLNTPDLALVIAGWDRHGALIIAVSDAREEDD